MTLPIHFDETSVPIPAVPPLQPCQKNLHLKSSSFPNILVPTPFHQLYSIFHYGLNHIHSFCLPWFWSSVSETLFVFLYKKNCNIFFLQLLKSFIQKHGSV